MPTTALSMLKLIWTHPANQDRRVRAICNAVGWQIYKRAIKRPLSVTVFGNLRLRCYPNSEDSSRILYFNGRPDYHEMDFMRNYLRPGDKFIDVGANVGIYTLLAASLVGPTGSVDSFEPGPTAVARLRENVALNGLRQVHVHAAAVNATNGFVAFVRSRDTGNRMQTAKDIHWPTVEVASIRLDDVLKDGPYALGKMDVEGAEPLAFVGAQRLLSEASPPVWQIELVDHFARRFGWTAADLVDWLRERDYHLATYDADRRELRFSRYQPPDKVNVLVIAGSVREEVVNRVQARVMVR